MKTIKGTGVALITPFLNDTSVDVMGLKSIVQHVINGGVDFLVPLGTTGESVTLLEEETHLVFQTVFEVNDGNLPVVMGCGGNDTHRVIAQMKSYDQKYAADAYLSVTPYYNKPSQEGLFTHFAKIADATHKSIILYNVPGRTGVNLLPNTVIRLATRFPNIIAIKEASGNIEQGVDILRRKPDHFSILSGDDTLVVPQLACGYEGVISVAANGKPQLFSQMVQAALSGNLKQANTIYYQLFPWMQLLFNEGNPVGIKCWMNMHNLANDTVREPLVKGSETLRGLFAELEA